MNALTRQLLDWVDLRPRTYAEAMDAWRSTCPRHTVWEDAIIDGLIEVEGGNGAMNESAVRLTAAGRDALRRLSPIDPPAARAGHGPRGPSA